MTRSVNLLMRIRRLYRKVKSIPVKNKVKKLVGADLAAREATSTKLVLPARR